MRTRFVFTLAPLLAFAPAAHADAQLDRFETLSEQVTSVMNEALILQVPSLEGNLPAAEWDDEMRDAYTCVVEQYRTEVGDDAINTMLDQMEAIVPDLTVDAMINGEVGENINMPEGLSEERSGQIVRDCGVMTIYMTRMMESGAAEILANR